MINIKYDIDTINNKRNLVKEGLFKRSNNIKNAEFVVASDADIDILYNLYDEIFFNSWFKHNFKGKIKFTLSRQLKRAAGNTKVMKKFEQLRPEDVEFQIKISINHLVNFDKVDRDKHVGGIEVKNKLDSLMLVLEHELCHVIEFLIYKESNCKKERFKNLIYNIFGHNETTHGLVSIKEANYKDYGFLVGDEIKFIYNDILMDGIISRINKRATVMTKNEQGKYIDKKGQRYAKYYVPLNVLIKK